MLDSIRKQGASAFIYLIFGLLIAIFIVNMGNGSGKQGGGCTGTSNTALTVDGKNVNHTSFLVAFSNAGHREGMTAKQRQFQAIELLIRRELLAREAEKHGIRVSSDLVEDEIKKGNFFLAGQRIPLGQQVFDEHDDGERTWNFKKFKGWVGSLNVSMTSYQDEQQRELQAVMMADLLKSSVQVNKDEAFKAWLYEHNTVTYDVVAYAAAPYEAAIRLTEADAARYLTLHEDEVKARFKQDERLYNDDTRKLQFRLRQIFVAKAEKDDKPDKHTLPLEDAKAKLESVRASASSDKAKFIAAAKDLSTDEVARALGGANGWHDASDPQLTEKQITDAVKALKVGEMTPVIATDKGVYLVLAEESREKKLTYDQVKLDIALDLAKHGWAKEKAKRDALAALADAHTGTGKNLDQMFEKEVEPAQPMPPGGIDPKQLEALPPEQRKMIEDMIKNSGKHGAIDVTTKDHLASWDSDAGGGGGGSASGSGSGSGSGSAAPIAGGPAPVPAPAPKVEELKPSTDDLPAFADVAKPKVFRPQPSPRSDHMDGLGSSKEIARALFDELTAGMLAKRVYETKGNYVLVQLITKTDAKPAEFDKRADKEIEDLREARAQVMLDSWLKARCEELNKDDKIKPSDDVMRETDESGKPVQSGYHPCQSFR